MSELIQLTGTESELDAILSPHTIRACAKRILAEARAGNTYFRVQDENIEPTAKFVAQVTLANYPSLEIPYHSRWKHFLVGQVDRVSPLTQKMLPLSAQERLLSKLDLVFISVLMDAGAGMKWSYLDPFSQKPFGKSEGLAVATLVAFEKGLFSSDAKNPLKVDAGGLEKLSWSDFEKIFQISASNPLEGSRGRFELLKSLAKSLRAQPQFFGEDARCGNVLLSLQEIQKKEGRVRAEQILRILQESLGEIWPSRVRLNKFPLGDVWSYEPWGKGVKALIPFHKLSQWLAYSLIDVLERENFAVAEVDGLTGLAEYRNGGLFIDREVLCLRNPLLAKEEHSASSPLIVEWRALTLALLEELAAPVRKALGLSAAQLPLGKMLEGGTWWAGRKAAAEKRKDGASPLILKSDGTVF